MIADRSFRNNKVRKMALTSDKARNILEDASVIYEKFIRGNNCV